MRIFEINTRVHCESFDQISADELREISRLGFDTLWLMGVWQISEGAKRISKIVSEDFEGSPYAVPAYKFNRQLGGKSQFAALVKRAHAAGLSVIVDFVSNHMALDSPWIGENASFFIRNNTQARKQSTAEFFLHRSGEVFAFGRDPYFPPWHDTAQLDYTNGSLRSRMIEVLKWISQVADGVRCDMAMLVLRQYIRNQWYPHAPEGWFNQAMPGEFWGEAISEVKAVRPDFLFIAEAYWEKERELLELGFDLAYEKRVYDGLSTGQAQEVVERLHGQISRLEKSLFFIENHDEPRAATLFERPGNLAAAALILALPGSVLIHEGQMEGKRERLPVQRIKPLLAETPDYALRQGYEKILKVTSEDLFRRGAFRLFDAGAYGVVAFLRHYQGRAVAYLGQISEAWHNFSSVPLNITELAQAVGATGRLRVTNMAGSGSALVEKTEGRFRIQLNQLPLSGDAKFCLLEAFAV